jgi:hypothetical protein
MPIDVVWEEMDWEANPSGPAPTRALKTVPDNHSVVERLLSSVEGQDFEYLRFISHDTVTFFHQQHISQLLTELELLGAQKHDPQMAAHLSAIRQLVSESLGAKDTLVTFRAR